MRIIKQGGITKKTEKRNITKKETLPKYIENKNIQQAEILFNTLLKAKMDSSLDYENFSKIFLPSVSPFKDEILKNLKANVMKGESKAYYILAKVNEIGFFGTKKDEYAANLLILISCKLKNRECWKIIKSEPTKYEIFHDIADNLINNYIGRM